MPQNRTLLIIILGMLSAIGPFSIDTYIAGFPSIASDFKVNIDTVSYSLSSFFIGISIGQMICGPLLDRYGRKTPLMIGLGLYVLASVGCAVATSIESFIILRFIQALGGCVGMVGSRAIVRDTFPVEEIAKVFSLLILILGVSPIIAPTIGSYLIVDYGWQSVFYLQALMGIVLLLTVFFLLPESKGADISISLKPDYMINSFWSIMKEPQFYTYAFAGSVISASIYAYLAGSPTIFMNHFGISEKGYGYIFGLVAGCLIFSSQINGFLLKRFTSTQIIQPVLFLQVSFGVLLLAGSITNSHNIYSLLILTCLFVACQGFSQPNTMALSLAPFNKEAGRASALIGAMQMGLASFSSALVGWLGNESSTSMTSVMFTCSALGLTIFMVGKSRL